jgi:uncharacterized membrane protein YcaP (DUF421 family)
LSPELRELLIPALPWWQLVLRGAVAYLGLLFLLRLSGKRTLAQLTAFDLLVTLLIAGALRQAMVGDDSSLTGGFIVATTLLALHHVVATLSTRSERIDRLVEGDPVLLARDGELFERRLVENRVPRRDFDEAMRKAGVDDLSRVKLATLETNGQITIVERD